jgi:hypothetical protein
MANIDYISFEISLTEIHGLFGQAGKPSTVLLAERLPRTGA